MEKPLHKLFNDYRPAWFTLLFALLFLVPGLFIPSQQIPMGNFRPSDISDLASWLPLATKFEFLGQDLFIYPYLTLGLQGLFIKIFGVANTYWIGQFVVPLAAFFFLFKIFEKYLSPLWSFSLSCLSLVCSSFYSFREFFEGLLMGRPGFTLEVFEIFHFPFPALSITFFLAVLLLTLNKRPLTWKYVSLMSFLWAIQTQVHAYNAFVGIPLWTGLCFLQARKEGKLSLWLYHLGITAVICLPWIIGLYHFSAQEMWLSATEKNTLALQPLLDYFYNLAYFALPLLLFLVGFVVQRVDPLEFLSRFSFVLIILCLEIVIVYADHFFFNGYTSHLVFSRLFIFLHYLYIIPFIHFLSRPVLFERRHGIESMPFSRHLRKLLYDTLARFHRIYLPVLLFVLFLFLRFSQVDQLDHFRNTYQTDVKRAEESIVFLEEKHQTGELVISDDPIASLLIVSHPELSGLWMNQFTSRASSREIVERLAIYGRTFKWTPETFLRFMTPGYMEQSHEINVKLSTETLPQFGLGHWLAFHNTRILGIGLNEQDRAEILKIYDEIDVTAGLKKYGVKKILANQPLDDKIPVQNVRRTPYGSLYTLR